MAVTLRLLFSRRTLPGTTSSRYKQSRHGDCLEHIPLAIAARSSFLNPVHLDTHAGSNCWKGAIDHLKGATSSSIDTEIVLSRSFVQLSTLSWTSRRLGRSSSSSASACNDASTSASLKLRLPSKEQILLRFANSDPAASIDESIFRFAGMAHRAPQGPKTELSLIWPPGGKNEPWHLRGMEQGRGWGSSTSSSSKLPITIIIIMTVRVNVGCVGPAILQYTCQPCNPALY